MLYEFIVYPHEVCKVTHEVIESHVYQEMPFVTSVQVKLDVPALVKSVDGSNTYPDGDTFDLACRDREDFREHAYKMARSCCSMIIDSFSEGHYFICMHYLDVSKDTGENLKPHFHIIFDMPHGFNFPRYDVYKALGMIKYVPDDFVKRHVPYKRFKIEFPCAEHPRLDIYEPFSRSQRLRYLCHLDNPEKVQYSLTDVLSDICYVDDPDVINPPHLTPFALFLGFKSRYKLQDECDWFEWLASARLNDDIRKQLGTIKTDIHRYYVSLYYRINKGVRSYS